MGTPVMSDNLRGALFMVVAMLGYAVNDGIMKSILAELPLFPSIALRGAIVTVFLGIAAWATGAFGWRPARRDMSLIGVRTLAEVATAFMFLYAVANIPLADATAILQAVPLAVTFGAMLFFGERVGWRRGAALAIGLIGVLLIIKPGSDSFNLATLMALGAVIAVVVRDLATRSFSKGVPSLLAAFYTAVATTTAALIGTLFTEIPDIPLPILLYAAIAAAFLMVANLFSILTVRTGDISFAAPFRYTVLLWSLLIGILFFAEIPDMLSIIGATMVVATGLYTFWREHVLSKARAV